MPFSVSPYARLDTMAEFREWLSAPPSQPAVDAYLDESAERATLLSGAILGSIRWGRELGVPQATARAAAFLVEQHVMIFLHYTADGEVWSPVKQDEAVLWDGPDDETHHRVTYFLPDTLAKGGNYGDTAVTVRLRLVWWPRTPPFTGASRLKPFGWEFPATGQGVTVLPEHELYVNRSDTITPLPF